MHLLILIKISIRIENLFSISIINFVKIELNKSISQTYHIKIFFTKIKALYFSLAAK